MASYVFACPAVPASGTDPFACSGGAWVDALAAADPSALGIDAGGITYAFTWGFGSVVLAWFFGYVIGVALTAIRKL